MAPRAGAVDSCLASLAKASELPAPILRHVAQLQLSKPAMASAQQARTEGDFDTAGRIEARYQKLGQAGI